MPFLPLILVLSSPVWACDSATTEADVTKAAALVFKQFHDGSDEVSKFADRAKDLDTMLRCDGRTFPNRNVAASVHAALAVSDWMQGSDRRATAVKSMAKALSLGFKPSDETVPEDHDLVRRASKPDKPPLYESDDPNFQEPELPSGVHYWCDGVLTSACANGWPTIVQVWQGNPEQAKTVYVPATEDPRATIAKLAAEIAKPTAAPAKDPLLPAGTLKPVVPVPSTPPPAPPATPDPVTPPASTASAGQATPPAPSSTQKVRSGCLGLFRRDSDTK